ncbi:uncharacterized protein IUM83_17014 [Phytophthora cinnamomi]|uniref:uncharacterized protein n=1 Tax=Phytophthora cinnamomi TaxID=4785 RepID=UPI0035598F8B|nr:hypothetical protein IUM83_17014 [Phytophthora cinnamomi]
MDLALNIVDVLRQIYELRDAIRRQRHVNRRTYLRMMEIYVELQSSEGIQANATLQRTATLDKFSSAVTKFLLYLQKYNDMHKVVRMFKFATMEEQRLKIVDEIDQLYRMLNLATAVAVMNGAAAAASNATSLFAKLEDMHGDIRLTHDQIHAALLADKRRIVVPRKRFLGDHEPVLEKSTAGRVGVDRILIRQVPILKKYAPAAVYAVKEEFPPQDDPTVEYDMMEEKSPVVPAMQWGETKRSAVANEAEEKASVEMKAEMQPGTADVVVGTKVQAVQRVELEDLKHFTAYDDEEEKEPNNRQLTPLQEVTEGMEKEESKPSCDEPGLVRSTDDEMISEKQGENMEPGDQQFVLIQESADKAVDEKEEEVASGGRQSSHVDDSVEVTDDETVKTSNEQEEVMRDTGDDVTDADGPEANDTRVQQSDEEAVISPTAPQADPEEAEENDPTTQQLTQDTVDEAHEPSIEQSDVFVEVYDEVVESLPGGGQVGTSNEAVEEINAVSAEQLSLKVEEMIDEPTQQPDEVIEDIEEDETSSQHSELLSDTTDETDAETDDFQPEASISVSLNHSSVPLLVQRLGFDQVPAQQQEDTLLDLLRIPAMME